MAQKQVQELMKSPEFKGHEARLTQELMNSPQLRALPPQMRQMQAQQTARRQTLEDFKPQRDEILAQRDELTGLSPESKYLHTRGEWLARADEQRTALVQQMERAGASREEIMDTLRQLSLQDPQGIPFGRTIERGGR